MPFRGAQYNEQHASLTGAAVWMYMVGQKERPIKLYIDRSSLPAAWKVATGLPESSREEYKAESYDSSADCPIEISNFVEKQFVALGTTYHVVVDNEVGDQDFSEFAESLRKSIELGVVPCWLKPLAVRSQLHSRSIGSSFTFASGIYGCRRGTSQLGMIIMGN